MPDQSVPEIELLRAAYVAFNARNIDAALALMTPGVVWPKAFKGGLVHGHREVREYWTDQWSEIDPHVEPIAFHSEEDGRILVDVHQVVRDLIGAVLANERTGHRFTLDGGLIQAMEVCTPLISGRSEEEKMLAGELYNPLDSALVQARERARDLCQDLNATRERDQDQRRGILKQLFGKGGESVWMQPPFFCDYGSNIQLGERVFFNFNCIILDVCQVKIGDFTLFGPAVQIYTATHPMNAVLRRQQEFAKPIEIGSDVWVGGGAMICPGVKIGSKSVIGAGSVVTRDIPSSSFAAGNPCQVIREITE